MNTQDLPSAFADQMKVLLPTDFEPFVAALKTAPPVSIRINSTKATPQLLEHLSLQDRVPWHPQGWYLSQRPTFTLDPLLHAGAYYVQEASSMLLFEALNQSVSADRPLRVLDLCAAPGGKTTLIASWMPKSSILIANEVIKTRLSILKQNLARWGNPNVFTCSYDPEAFLPLAGWFDLVVVDAPCSGEGLFRKNALASQEWSLDNVSLCSARQRRILQVAQKLVNPRGTLIYSTCTYNARENDDNSRWLQAEKGMQALAIDTPECWGVSHREEGLQMYPHRAKGEGFYLSAFRQLDPIRAIEKRKKDFRKLAFASRKELELFTQWIPDAKELIFLKTADGSILHAPASLQADLLTLDHMLPQGVWLHETGQVKGNDLIPSHTLALQSQLIPDAFPSVELTESEVLQYLKKELQEIQSPSKGWQLVKYKHLPLGWIRHLGNRFNNYYPTEQRIRMEIRKAP
jgi:16S rRNA C967 or C1407 C5-methylase (RsmB/RsmF family)